VVVALVLFGAAGFDSAPPRPNIVFFLADDVGVNDFKWGSRHLPNFSRRRPEFMNFYNAYAACPVCSPTRAAIMTGKNPARLQLTTFLPGRPDAPSQKLLHPVILKELPLEEVTIAERLKAVGYATGCIGKWHLGGAGFGPKQQGFDFAYAGKANTNPSESEGGKGEYDLTRRAEEFISANKDKPFFLYLCHNSPHIPLAAKKEFIEANDNAFNPVYTAMIETLDDCFDRVLRKLDELKLSDKTIVVFTSDNGGLHVPEGKDDPPTTNAPFRAGKGFLYEGGLRVPLSVRNPYATLTGRFREGCFNAVISMDWTPTIMEWCGIASGEQFDGVSLAPLFHPRRDVAAPEFSRTFYWHFPHYTNQGSRPGGAIRDGKWKLIEHYEDGKLELFDLSADNIESTNLATTQSTIAVELKKKLDDWKAAANVQHNTPNPAFDPALHSRLYIETDVSTLKAAATAAETAKPLREWRRLMDGAVRKK